MQAMCEKGYKGSKCPVISNYIVAIKAFPIDVYGKPAKP